MPEKSLVINNEKLMQEWIWNKNHNLGLDPSQLTCGSHVKAWWRCSRCGSEFQGTIVSRSHATSCKNCMLKKRTEDLLQKKGSLASINPELAEEWHPTKNGSLNPNMVMANSPQKVWWQCRKGHEWQASPNNRQQCGCPYCSGQRAWEGDNDLATKNPNLARQWHPTKNGKLLPSQVTTGSNMKVWWQCEKGHEWFASISNRVKSNGCPICSNQQLFKGYNDLATTHPLVSAEWCFEKNEGLKPDMFMAGSDKQVWWQCSKGHVWKARIAHRSNGSGCPICSNEKQTSFPEQAILFYFKKITTAISRFKIKGKTEVDIFLPDLNIGIEYDGLNYHKGEKARQKEENKYRVLKQHGIILLRLKEKEDCNISVDDNHVIYYRYTTNSQYLGQAIAQLILEVNHVTDRLFVVDINIEKDRSAIYDSYIETEKQRSLQEANPKLAAEWHPTKNNKLLPEMVTATSNKTVWWQCDKGHEWQAQISNRSAGKSCPYCANRKVLSGYNDLETVNPLLSREWHPTKNYPLLAKEVLPHTNKKVWWQCEKGHEWEATVNSRSSGTGCPYCANKRILSGYNDLQTANPELAEEWHPTNNGDLTASQIAPKSSKMVWWLGKCGHEWQDTVYNRTNGSRCPYCYRRKVSAAQNHNSKGNHET